MQWWKRQALPIRLLSLCTLMSFAVAACEDDASEEARPTQEEVIDLDVTGGEGCEVAGYQELTAYLGENGIGIYHEDLEGEAPTVFCTLGVVWSLSDGGDEHRTMVNFGLSVFDTVAEAEETLEHPGRLTLTSKEFREPAVGLESNAPAPWDDGFIWSTPDSYDLGQTEAAARTSNIVVWVKIQSHSPASPDRCDGEGEHCGVPSSELTAWLYDEYLPAVAENVLERAEG